MGVCRLLSIAPVVERLCTLARLALGGSRPHATCDANRRSRCAARYSLWLTVGLSVVRSSGDPPLHLPVNHLCTVAIATTQPPLDNVCVLVDSVQRNPLTRINLMVRNASGREP